MFFWKMYKKPRIRRRNGYTFSSLCSFFDKIKQKNSKHPAITVESHTRSIAHAYSKCIRCTHISVDVLKGLYVPLNFLIGGHARKNNGCVRLFPLSPVAELLADLHTMGPHRWEAINSASDQYGPFHGVFEYVFIFTWTHSTDAFCMGNGLRGS